VAVANGADGARCAEERNADAKLGVRGSFCYRYVGRLESGAHVLKTISSSEGSGSFASVMLVRFDEGTILWQGRLEPQLRMSVIATQALQQGTGETVKLSGNKILVSTGTDAAIPTGARSAGAAPAFDELDFAQAIAATPAPASAQAPPPASAPAAIAAAPVGETVEYHCGSGSNLIATYYAEEDRAVVSYHGKAALMQISMSASGARYLGGGWVWWTRGMTEGSLFNATANGEAGKQLEQCTAPDEAAPATEPGR
jgi:membrane-bound inhibitor of C-type lysozyme